jgi:Family of unknown function (DUF5309)
MASVTNTFLTFAAKGIREDLTDIIYNISPTQTPFMSTAGKTKAQQTFHEWQTDSLATASTTNAQLQGDDITTFDPSTATSRLGNYTQILRKTVIISDTLDVVKKAGRASEVAYQVAKKLKELKRDMEATLCNNQQRSAGSTTSASQLAGLESWIFTNTSAGAGGSGPAANDGTGFRVDGTQRPFTEAIFKTVLGSIYDNSGEEPDIAMMGRFNKQVASTFAGNATRMNEADTGKLFASVDIYEYDFGTLKLVPNRFQRSRSVFVINPELWAVAFLRPVKIEDLAKTGDAEKKMIITEMSLESRNEAGSGIIADLTTS